MTQYLFNRGLQQVQKQIFLSMKYLFLFYVGYDLSITIMNIIST